MGGYSYVLLITVLIPSLLAMLYCLCVSFNFILLCTSHRWRWLLRNLNVYSDKIIVSDSWLLIKDSFR